MTLKSSLTCNDVKDQLDAYLDGELTGARYQAIELHLQLCSTCKTLFTQRRQLLDAMKSMPRIQASPALLRRIVETRATKQHQQHQQHQQKVIWFSTGAASALVVSILLLIVTFVFKPLDSSTQSMSAVIATLNEAHDINFVVNSDQALENVTFSVLVPSNIQLKGYSGLHELAWNGKLIKGDNLLSLPVIAHNAAPGILVMRIQHRNAEKEYRINISVGHT